MANYRVWIDTRGPGWCRSAGCQAPITWFKLVSTGKAHPFDGDVIFTRTEQDPEANRPIGTIDSSINPSHFSTCPAAAEWRKPK